MAQVAAIQIKLSLQTTGEAAVKKFIQSIQKLTVTPPKIDFGNSISVSSGSLQRAIQKQMPLVANTIADGIEVAFVRIWHRFSDFLGLLETEAQKKKGLISKILFGDNAQTTIARQFAGVAAQFKILDVVKRAVNENVGLGVASYRTLQDTGISMVNHYTNKVGPMLLDATQKSYKLTTVVTEAEGMMRRGNGLLQVLGSSLLTVGQGLSGLLTTGGYFFFSGIFSKGASQFIARFLGIQKGTALLERINRIVITIDRSLHHAHLTIGSLLKSTSIGVAAFVPTIFGIINPFNTIITKLAFVNSLVTILSGVFERRKLEFAAFLGSGTAQIRLAFLNVRDFLIALTTDAGFLGTRATKIFAFFGSHSAKLKLGLANFREFFMSLTGMMPKITESLKNIIGYLPTVTKEWGKMQASKDKKPPAEQSSAWERIVENQLRSAQRVQAMLQSQQKIRTAIQTSQLALPYLSTQATSRATPVRQERPTVNVLPSSGQRSIPLQSPQSLSFARLPDLRPEAEQMKKEILLSIQKLRRFGFTWQEISQKFGELAKITTTEIHGNLQTRTQQQTRNFSLRGTVPDRYLTQPNVDKARVATAGIDEATLRYISLRAKKIPDEIAKGIQQDPEKLKKAMDIMAEILLQYLPASPAKAGPLRSLRARGKAILSELAIGMNSNTSKLKQSVSHVAQSVARFFPHSPAEEGPLRNLREWGQKILGTISLGLSDKLQSFLGFFWNLGQQIRNIIKPILEFEMQGERAGIDAQTMSLLQYAFVGFEVSASDVQMSLLGINRTLSEIVTPEKQMALARVGINISKIRNAANPSYEALLQLADATQKFPLASQEMIKAFDAIGISNQTNLINGLSQGRAKIEEAMREGVEMGAAYNKTFVKAGHDFTEMLNKIDNITSYLEREFVDVILPIVDDMIRKLFDFYKDNAESVRAFVRILAEVFKVLIKTVSQAIALAIENPTQAKEAAIGFFIFIYQTAASLLNAFWEDSFDGLSTRVWLFLYHTVGAAIEAAGSLLHDVFKGVFVKLGLWLMDMAIQVIQQTNLLGYFVPQIRNAVNASLDGMRALIENAGVAEGDFETIIKRAAENSTKIMAQASAEVEKDVLAMSDPAVIKKTLDRFKNIYTEIVPRLGGALQGTGFDKIFLESMAEINKAISAGTFEKARTEIQKMNREFKKLPSILDKTGQKSKKIGNVVKNEVQSVTNNIKNGIMDAGKLGERESQQLEDKILGMQLDLSLRTEKNDSKRSQYQSKKDSLELKGKQDKELAEYEQLLHAKYIQDDIFAGLSTDQQKIYIKELAEYKDFVGKQEEERKQQKKKPFKILDDKQTETINAWQSSFNDLGTAFGNMYDLMGKKATAFFYLQKGVAVADATISGTMATLNAYEKGMQVGGPTVAAIFAAMAAAMSATQIATIVAQAIQGPTAMATGGTVPGQGNKDTVPAMLTPGEFVMPRGVVAHYGLEAMEAMRQRLVSKEVFGNLASAIPKPEFSQSLNFNNGGIIPPFVTPAQPQQPINIVNVQDSTQIDRYMASHHGQQVVMNIVSNNFSQLQRRMK